MTRDKPNANDEPNPTIDNERPPFLSPHVSVVTCHFCNRSLEPKHADGFDLSREDEYYPRMVPVCPEHEGCR